MSFDLIIFDLDGTLYQFDKGANNMFNTKFYAEVKRKGVEFLAARLSLPLPDAAIVRENIFKKYNGDVSVGLEKEFSIPRREYFENTWNANAAEYIMPNETLRDLLSNIKAKKAVLTAAPEIWARRALQQLSIEDLFDGMWFGDRDPIKPSGEAYLQVTCAFNTAPDKTAVIDDQQDCLKVAKNLGFTTILVAAYVDYSIKNITNVDALVGVEK